ncbi:Uma2 family endonuclease [Dyadobacter psychrotolerans]|uniref:Uma2 family endonuclease n=1 Tax=Dyadobacter psychrotolerans TaxID=2541721 RepID=UPI001E2AE759|nr:Uma2 family endonuclease [Dyadobacter psychrotolerans]
MNLPSIKPFTDSELVSFCFANPDLNVERDEQGQLFIQMAASTALMSANRSELMGEIGIWNRINKKGKVLSSGCGYFLPDTSMLTADIAWISFDRWNTITDKRSFLALAPDFIIELMAGTDNLDVLKAKMVKWIENGVKLAWLVCMEEKTTYVYQNGNLKCKVSFEEYLSGGTVLPGLDVRLSDFFEIDFNVSDNE